MDLHELIKKLFSNFFTIYTGCMLGTIAFCLIFEPDATFSISYFIQMLGFTLVGDLPLCIYYSKNELTSKQWKYRMILHFIVLSLLMLIVAWYLGLYKTLVEGIVMFIIISGVYALVCLIDYRRSEMEAIVINQRLKERKQHNNL